MLQEPSDMDIGAIHAGRSVFLDTLLPHSDNAIRYILHATCRMLHLASCMLHAACCMLHAACRMPHAACCMLHAACCMLRHAVRDIGYIRGAGGARDGNPYI